METDVRIISTTEELEILSDPFRLSIINAYREHGKPLTVTGCAELLNVVPAKVHYHVKKLLKIHVLELDHIEVINGINAKYYHLPHKRFALQIKDDTDDVMETNLKHVMNMAISQIDNFKLDFLTMSQATMARKESSPYEVGWFGLNNIYLNEEEFDQLQEMLIDFVTSHTEKVEDKRRYSFIMGISRKQDL